MHLLPSTVFRPPPVKKRIYFQIFILLFIRIFFSKVRTLDYVRRLSTHMAKNAAEKSALSPQAAQAGNGVMGKDYTSPAIEQLGCAITVVLMEPSITPRTHIALESVAANIRPRNRACFLIQTSVCRMGNDSAANMTNFDKHVELMRQIQSLALPHFHRMLQDGQVRVTILDSAKYKFRVCDNFYSPARAWLDYRYWGPDEFNDADTDQVLMIQSDVVLCHPFAINKWKSFAWVAPPWPPKRTGEGGWCMCRMMPGRWKRDHASDEAPLFPTEEDICSDRTKSPIGNGGYSLRSRSWVRRAISYCPHPTYSNLPENITINNQPKCHVSAYADQEDFILTTILRGIGAPFPDAYDAALFGAEMRFPGTYEKQYYNYNDTNSLELIAENRWFGADEEDDDIEPAAENITNETALERFQRMRAAEDLESPIVPIGLHKPWNYHHWIKTSAYFKVECPYLFEMLKYV